MADQQFSYSHGRHIASDILRGALTGALGVVRAKRMAREAKTEKQRWVANQIYRSKMLELHERQASLMEGAAGSEQTRLDFQQVEQDRKSEGHNRLAEAYDRLESVYQERNRARDPKEIEQLENEIAMEARTVVRLGKRLGYSYPYIEQGLKEKEDAMTEFKEKGTRIDRLDVSDERKAELRAALGNEFFGLQMEKAGKVDEILGQLEAIEKLDETPERKQELKDSYLNKEFGVDASAAAEAAKKAEALQVLEKNKDAFSEQEYARIKGQIELGEMVDVKGLLKPSTQTDFGSTEEILDIYRDIPNRTVLNSIGSISSGKDEAQRFVRSAHRWLAGRPFEEVDETSKKRVAKLFINEVMENVAGGDIVKQHLRAYRILKDHLPALLSDVAQLETTDKRLGRLTEAAEGSWRWEGGSDDPEVTALRKKLTDAFNGYIALRSDAQGVETEHSLYTSLFADIGRGYEGNKATLEGLMESVLRDLSAVYKAVMGPEWGEYATAVDFQQDTEPSDVWISEVLKDYELAGKDEVVVSGGAEPSQVVDILAEGAGSIMEAKNLTPAGYEKSVEAQLRKRYPDLPDDEIDELMDDFREKADLSVPETEEETESEDTAFDRAPRDTDFKYTATDGVEYNLHAEVAYMIDVDGWTREQIKAELQRDYPELSDEEIEAVLNDPEFKYPGDDE